MFGKRKIQRGKEDELRRDSSLARFLTDPDFIQKQERLIEDAANFRERLGQEEVTRRGGPIEDAERIEKALGG